MSLFGGMALLFLAIGWGIAAEKRADAVISYGDCVWEQVEKDDFPGTYQEAWEVYHEVCRKK